MQKLIQFIIIIVSAILISSCLHDKGELTQPKVNCDSTIFALQIKPIIEKHCAIAGCHVPGTGTDNYTTYELLKTELPENTRTRINLNPSDPLHMPSGAVLSPDDLAKLNNWINSGFPGCD